MPHLSRDERGLKIRVLLLMVPIPMMCRQHYFMSLTQSGKSGGLIRGI